MNKVNLKPWWKLTENGFPTAKQAAKALERDHKGIWKYLKGQRVVSRDGLGGLLALEQPEGAKEYLEALVRGAPPEELSGIEARATTNKKGPAPTQKTEEEPNPSQGQSSSNGAPNLQALPLEFALGLRQLILLRRTIVLRKTRVDLSRKAEDRIRPGICLAQGTYYNLSTEKLSGWVNAGRLDENDFIAVCSPTPEQLAGALTEPSVLKDVTRA